MVPYVLYCLIYQRVYRYKVLRDYYESQGVTVIRNTAPFLGSFIAIAGELWQKRDPSDNKFVVTRLADEIIGSNNSVTALYFADSDPMLHISDPKIVQDLYTTNNKFFDKHPIVRTAALRLLGNSILFADTNEEWKKRRTAFSPAFYKGKLVKMVDIAKECVRKTVGKWRTITGGKPRQRLNFMEEMQMMSGRIILTCALGEDISERLIPYRYKGRTEMR